MRLTNVLFYALLSSTYEQNGVVLAVARPDQKGFSHHTLRRVQATHANVQDARIITDDQPEDEERGIISGAVNKVKAYLSPTVIDDNMAKVEAYLLKTRQEDWSHEAIHNMGITHDQLRDLIKGKDGKLFRLKLNSAKRDAFDIRFGIDKDFFNRQMLWRNVMTIQESASKRHKLTGQ